MNYNNKSGSGNLFSCYHLDEFIDDALLMTQNSGRICPT